MISKPQKLFLRFFIVFILDFFILLCYYYNVCKNQNQIVKGFNYEENIYC